jgi:hypothetical protein
MRNCFLKFLYSKNGEGKGAKNLLSSNQLTISLPSKKIIKDD